MTRPARPVPRLAELAALTAAVDWDERQSGTVQNELDRQVAPALAAAGADPVAAGRVWLEAVSAQAPEVQAQRERTEQVLAWGHAGMLGLGLLLGWLATLGVFYYDGTGRVNVVVALAVLVVIPAILLLPLLISALPESILAALPGAAPLSAAFRAISPGRLAPWLMRWLPQDRRETWNAWRGRLGAHHALYRTVEKWMLLRWSQLFALGYQTAAVLTATALVIFTDLAFGWSTTLTTGDPSRDAERVHHVTSTLALPWAAVVPDSAPAIGLIEESRYYRAAAPALSPTDAARLGGWWRFVVLALLVYGWLPRLLTLVFTHRRVQASARAAWSATPRLTAILRRVRSAAIQTVSPEVESKPESYTLHPFALAGSPPTVSPGPELINWSSVPLAEEILQARLQPVRQHAAGGAASMQADQALIAQLGAATAADHEVAIVVKAWEPPLLEFVDFVRSLRQALGRSRMILVLPVGVDGSGEPQAASEGQFGVWQRKLAQLGDPWLRVARFPAEGTP